jgi:hypothetical protein
MMIGKYDLCYALCRAPRQRSAYSIHGTRLWIKGACVDAESTGDVIELGVIEKASAGPRQYTIDFFLI